MTADDDIGAAITKEMTAIFEGLPEKLNIRGILQDAYARLIITVPNTPPHFIAEKLSEVMREIATIAVEEFTRRTGQPFMWVDDPPPIDDEPLMSFSLDDKGNVIF